MLQQDKPVDYVIATGVQYSVRQFIEMAADELGITLRWEGTGTDEVGIVDTIKGDAAPNVSEGDAMVRIDPRYYRPAEVQTLLGDPTKAAKELNWKPKIDLPQMISEMVQHDLNYARQHALLRSSGFSVSVPKE
jgi:GDPmannose 4,6-dehydratase